MDWPTAFSSAFSSVSAGVVGVAIGSVLTLWIQHRLNIDRDKLAEERMIMQKRREACSAVADILGEWIKPNYIVSETNVNRWQIQTTYWRNILSLDKRLVDIIIPRLANSPKAAEVNEIIVEARRIVLNLKERDMQPSDLNTWPPESEQTLR